MSPSEPSIPQRRSKATVHLQRAAKSSIGSAEEFYSVQASIAESLIDLVEAVQLQNKVLIRYVEELQKKTEIRYEFKNGAGEVLMSEPQL